MNKYSTGLGELQLKADHFKSVKSIIRIDAWDTEGCTVQANKEAFVTIASISHPETCIPIPNVFTPDGDGINDVFLGGDEFAYHEFRLEIFNTWGNRLYDGFRGWNGTYKGRTVPSDDYYYILQLKLPNGTSKKLKGTVFLIQNRH